MRLTTTVEVSGENLDTILERATSQLTTYFGEQEFVIEGVDATPLTRADGRVELWTGYVTGVVT